LQKPWPRPHSHQHKQNLFFHDNLREIAYMMRKVVRVFRLSITFIIMAMKVFFDGQYAMVLFQQNQIRHFFTITYQMSVNNRIMPFFLYC
jgi:hypothetical protein